MNNHESQSRVTIMGRNQSKICKNGNYHASAAHREICNPARQKSDVGLYTISNRGVISTDDCDNEPIYLHTRAYQDSNGIDIVAYHNDDYTITGRHEIRNSARPNSNDGCYTTSNLSDMSTDDSDSNDTDVSFDHQKENNPEPVALIREEVIHVKPEGVTPHNQLDITESTIQKQTNCIICFELVVKHFAFDPCGHVGCCDGCIRKLKKKVCPVCNDSFNKTLQIFHSN